MSKQKNRFAYATLIDHGYNPANPVILLELGMEGPVDWDALDAKGELVCRQLDFVLTVDYVKIGGEPLGIRCVYDGKRGYCGTHFGGLHVYQLFLRPLVDMRCRDSYLEAFDTTVKESVNVRRRSWVEDIGQVRISWSHAPHNVIRLDNGAFKPEETGEEPVATEEELQRMKDALDAWDPGAAAPAAPEPLRKEVDIDLAEPLPQPARLRLVS